MGVVTGGEEEGVERRWAQRGRGQRALGGWGYGMSSSPLRLFNLILGLLGSKWTTL
jgi:hypothetical protein